VQLALAEKFHCEHPEISKESLETLFGSSPPASDPSKQVTTADIQKALEADIAAWKTVRLGDDERSTLRHRWRKSLKKTKALTQQTLTSTDPKLWHSWRKAVKRLRYQREFLAMIHPRILGKKDARIRHLGTRLGDHNDLAIFSRQLGSAELKSADLNALKKAVAIEHQNIKRNCRRLGRKLFGRM
jgi:CHAD domain-containing protein